VESSTISVDDWASHSRGALERGTSRASKAAGTHSAPSDRTSNSWTTRRVVTSSGTEAGNRPSASWNSALLAQMRPSKRLSDVRRQYDGAVDRTRNISRLV